MVGLIHKLLFDLIETTVSPDAVLEVRQRAGIPAEKEFRMNEVYDDEEWQRLFAAACDVLNITPQQAEEAFADVFYKDALNRWPVWFQMSNNAREFLERQPRIHNGFSTGVQNPEQSRAINDKFRLDSAEDELIIHYRSPNRLCGLYQALARRIIDHYADQATVHEVRCLKNGDSECEIHICWQ